MRYTRYDYKKNKGDNFFLWIIGIIVFSICIGMIFYNLFLKESNLVDTKNENKIVKNEEHNDNIEFGVVQCGVFKDKANAESTLKSLDAESTAFFVEEDENFKLMYGIYTFDEAGKKSDSLTALQVSNFRIKCLLDGGTDEKKAESEILNAYIKIVNKVTEKDIKSVDTKEFKSWTNDIESKVDNPSEELGGLVSNINKLPDEYKKENQKDSLVQIYNILKKYKQK